MRISAGTRHTCAIRTGGQVLCWGENYQGELGDGSSDPHSKTPRLVKGVGGSGRLDDATAISSGIAYSCAIRAGGQAVCWGSNEHGRLGDNTGAGRSVPVTVHGPGNIGLLGNVTAISAGHVSTCAIQAGGQVFCWGSNMFGALGYGSAGGSSSVPRAVTGTGGGSTVLNDAIAVSVGNYWACALRVGGQVVCWGWNDNGQLGNGGTSDSPIPVPVRDVTGTGQISDGIAISSGTAHACVIRAGGQTVCWGQGSGGKLGNDSQSSSEVPVLVQGVGGGGSFLAAGPVSAGGSHSCAIAATGDAVCWGSGNDGQIGNDSTSNSLTPTMVVRGEDPEVIDLTGPAGPAGPEGPAGPTGPAGPAGTVPTGPTVPGTTPKPTDTVAIFDGKRLHIRLKCGPQYRPACSMTAVPTTAKTKKAKPIAKALKKKIKAGKWIRVSFLVKPKFRAKVTRMAAKNSKQLFVRQKVRSKKLGKKPFKGKARTVFHRYRVRSTIVPAPAST